MKLQVRVQDVDRNLLRSLWAFISLWSGIALWEFSEHGFFNSARIFWIPLTLGSSIAVLVVFSIEVRHALTNEGMLEDQENIARVRADYEKREPLMSYLRFYSSLGLIFVFSSLSCLIPHAFISGFSRFLFTSGYNIEDSLSTFSLFYVVMTILSVFFVIWRLIIAVTVNSKYKELVWNHCRAQILKNGGLIIPTLFATFFYQFSSVDLFNKNVLIAVFCPLFSVAIYFLIDTKIVLSVQTNIGEKNKGISLRHGSIYSCILMIILLLFYPLYIFT